MCNNNDLKKYCPAVTHYDMLIDENNDPFNDLEAIKDYMNKWDGEFFINKLALEKGDNVLEIGIGTGRLASRTAPLCRRLTDIDISQKTIERAKQNLSGHGNINFICGDFMSHHFEENFSVIYSSLTFMHIKNKQKAIQKAYGLLRLGGRFILSIDKNQNEVIDFGNRKVKIYPDDPDNTEALFKKVGFAKIERDQTELAHIFSVQKQIL